MKIERTREEIITEVKQWSEYLLECVAAINKFRRYATRAAQDATTEEEFMQAFREVSNVGGEGVLDDAYLDVDKLHDLLVERAEWVDDRPLIEQIFGLTEEDPDAN